MRIEIVALTRELEPAYNRFLLENPRSLVYAAPEFRDFLAQAVGGEPCYSLARRGDRIVGALPLFSKEEPRLGRVLNSLPWYGSHGGCALGRDGDGDVRTALLAPLRDAVAASDLLSATLILTPFENDHLATYAEALKPRAYDERVGQMTELPEPGPDLDGRLERTLQQKTRNLVRKARKQGFQEWVGNDEWGWRFLRETHAANMAAIGGKAKPWEHFEALRACLPRGWIRLSVALDETRPVAALLLVLFNRTVEYVTPVIDHDHRSRQPLSFLIWRAMLAAIESGYRWWNWGGTWASQKALHHFKAGWGAEDTPYTYLVCAREAALKRLQAERERAFEAFPFYYLYPLSLLE